MLSHLNKIWSYNHQGMISGPEFLQKVRSMLNLEAKRLRDKYNNRDQEKPNDMSELRVMINDLSSINVYHQVGLESDPESQSAMAGILQKEYKRLQMEEKAKNLEDEDDDDPKDKSVASGKNSLEGAAEKTEVSEDKHSKDMAKFHNVAAQVPKKGKLQKQKRNRINLTHLQGMRPGD